jgi:hypothetical protein
MAFAYPNPFENALENIISSRKTLGSLFKPEKNRKT